MLKLKTLPKKSRFVFEWTEDRHGTEGWLLRGMPDFDVVQGMALAHDCLEHFTHEGDGAESEYTAFGAILWGRFCNDYYGTFKPYPRPHQALFKELGEEVAGFAHTLGIPSAAEGYENPMLDEEIEEIITTMQIGMRMSLESELEIYGDEKANAVKVLTSWIRYGYLSAENTYGKWSSGFNFVNMFFNLENHIDDHHKFADHGEVLVIDVFRDKCYSVVRRGYYDDNGKIRYERKGEQV